MTWETGLYGATFFVQPLSLPSHFWHQPLKKTFEIGSVLKTPKKDDNFFRFKASNVLT